MYTDDSTAFPQGLDPIAAIESFNAAWNAHDVERVLSYFTDDAVVRFMYPPPYPEPDTYTGKEEIRKLLEGYLVEGFRAESFDHDVSLNQITWRYRSSSERFRQLGVDPVEGSAGASFERGKIKRLTISFSPESTAAIEAGLTRSGIGGPIADALTGQSAPADSMAPEGDATQETGPERPNRGPTWDPVGAADHQPPPSTL